jgi:ubiquinone/menaquinone biosynthesis C-methylase UbiE
LPAARAVGPTGRVDGVDRSQHLLAAGRERAAPARLRNAEFHAADVSGWTSPGRRPYDVVLCVFGVLFLPDLDAGGAHLLSLLRQGGQLVVTTWERGSDACALTRLPEPGSHRGIAGVGAGRAEYAWTL